MTAVENPPQQNQNGNTNNRRTNWILQLLFQFVLARIVYSLFINSQKNLNVNDSGRFPTFKNFFSPGDLFDVYGVLTNDIRIDFQNIEKYGKIIYANQNKVYSHKFNNPYEGTRVKIKPNDKFFNDLKENLYLAVFVIPHKSYESKNEVFYKSKFKEGVNGHYLVKTIPLTKVKKDTKQSAVHLMNSRSNAKESGDDKESRGFKSSSRGDDKENKDTAKKELVEDKKYWLPRLDINLIYDEKVYSTMKNDIYFETFTKHYAERLYDPVLYLSQFWVLEENMVPVNPLSDFDNHGGKNDLGKVDDKERGKQEQEHEKKEKQKDDKNDNQLDRVENEFMEKMNMKFENLKLEGETESGPVVLEDSGLSEMQLLLSKDEVLVKRVELMPEEVVDVKKKPFFKKFVFKKDTEVKTEVPLPRLEEGEFELLINFSSCSPMYYMMVQNMNANHSNNFMGIDNSKEIDTLKKTILNTNIYYLIFSAAFIMLHTIFSIFAFKNDIQFWYNNKSMEGLSTITMFINFVSEIIIGLYVYDSEKSSFIILFEILLSVGSSFWKLTKAVKIKFVARYPFFVIVKQSSYIENKTKEYDKVAIKYMSILLAPCIAGYAVYSLYYHKHKSWYSYIISVLAGSVYTFGFIMMTPQLYINYKLKSVEHLPWRALIYKSLNTFVDDVASFLIDMPFLHRLSCFRDDIIFFCYLYQRWKYKVDPNRNNPNHIPEENQENKSLDNEVTNEGKEEEVDKESRKKQD